MVDLAKMLDVDDAELNLVQVKGNLARTKRDYLVACVNLERATGTLGKKNPRLRSSKIKADRHEGIQKVEAILGNRLYRKEISGNQLLLKFKVLWIHPSHPAF